VQQNQLNNLRLNPVPGQGDWCELGFVVKGAGTPPQDFYPVRLRIARREGGQARPIDPNSTRLVIQVDVGPNETIQADLSLAGKQIRADIMASNEILRQNSEEELPNLREGLSKLGYLIKDARVEIGEPKQAPLVPVLPYEGSTIRGVNVKI
jgi:hypothetical protein